MEPTTLAPHDTVLDQARAAFRAGDWDALVACAPSSLALGPDDEELAWLLSFGLTHRDRHLEAAALLERAYASAPGHRLASALAYVLYEASLRLAAPRHGSPDPEHPTFGPEDRTAVHEGFLHWIEEALRYEPGSIKDLYRFGVFEAQLDNCHDAAALRAFLGVVERYRALSAEVRARRGDLFRYYARTLYAGARSALRLGKLELARRLAFELVRVDEEGRHVERHHQLGLAGRICLATRELDAAERAFRLALDASPRGRSDHLFGRLAEVELARGRCAEAARWIEAHVRPERRTPALFRTLGDARSAEGDAEAAESAYRASLLRDRVGKHLTLTRLGWLLLRRGQAKEAERAFTDANAFRRRRYQSEHVEALRGLAEAQAARGRDADAAATRERLEALVARRAHPGSREAA
ncbi:MAG: hypothetical protein U0230_20645 [Polyangiales bacterium]